MVVLVRYAGDNPCESGMSRLSPMKHQTQVFTAIIRGIFQEDKLKGILCTVPMGGGKTLIMNIVSSCLWCRIGEEIVKRVVIIVPNKVLVGNMYEGFLQMATGKIPKGNMNELAELMSYNVPFADYIDIVTAKKFLETYKKYDHTGLLIIVDEAHSINPDKRKKKKNDANQSTDGGDKGKGKAIVDDTDVLTAEEKVQVFGAMKCCCAKGARLLLFTATPITNNMRDLVSLYNLVSCNRESDEVTLNADEFRDPQRNIDFLKKLAAFTIHVPYMFLDDEHRNQYPNCNITYKTVEVADMAQRHSDELVNYDRQKDPFRLQQQALLLSIDHSKGMAILNDIIELYKDQGNRIVVFSRVLTKFLNHLGKKLGDNGIGYLTVNGSNSGQINETKRKFRESKRERVILVSIESGGVGLNLQTGTHVLICEPHYSYGVMEQAIARVVRPVHQFAGTNKRVQVIIYMGVLPNGYYYKVGEEPNAGKKAKTTSGKGQEINNQLHRIKTGDEVVYNRLMKMRNLILESRLVLEKLGYQQLIRLQGDGQHTQHLHDKDFDPTFEIPDSFRKGEPDIKDDKGHTVVDLSMADSDDDEVEVIDRVCIKSETDAGHGKVPARVVSTEQISVYDPDETESEAEEEDRAGPSTTRKRSSYWASGI